ncbi:MAG: hypothetical protein ACREKL_03805 [Chthoniobacterales bacterium]
MSNLPPWEKLESKIASMVEPHEREDFDRRHHKKSTEILRCMFEFLNTMDGVRTKKQPDAEAIWNANFHVNLVAHDLCAAGYLVFISEDRWATRLAARTLAMMLLEACDDIPSLLGKPFKDACTNLGIMKFIEQDWKESRQRIANFRTAHEAKLKRIRDALTAHKDHDTTAVVAEISRIRWHDYVDLSIKFESILRFISKMGMEAVDRANEVYRARGII